MKTRDETMANESQVYDKEELTQVPLLTVIPLTVLHSIIFSTGLIGNLCTCIVISGNKFMRTATNYYLFNLAISDLLLLVFGLPEETYLLWSRYPYVFGRAFCKIRGLAAETSANTSILTITAFTIERYVAICHPLLSRSISRPSRAIRVIVFVWITGIILALPQALQFDILNEGKATECNIKEEYRSLNAFIISAVVFFAIPMTVITFLYVRIGMKLRTTSHSLGHGKQRQPQQRWLTFDRLSVSNRSLRLSMVSNVSDSSANTCHHSYKRRVNERKSVIKMLVAVVAAFFICWAPFHAQRVLALNNDKNPEAPPFGYIFLYHLSGILYYVSATINPILYQIMSQKFRHAMKTSWKSLCSCEKGKQTSRIARDCMLPLELETARTSDSLSTNRIKAAIV